MCNKKVLKFRGSLGTHSLATQGSPSLLFGVLLQTFSLEQIPERHNSKEESFIWVSATLAPGPLTLLLSRGMAEYYGGDMQKQSWSQCGDEEVERGTRSQR